MFLSLIKIIIYFFVMVGGLCILVNTLNSLLKMPGNVFYLWGVFFICEVLQYSLPSAISIPLVTSGLDFGFFSIWSGDVVAFIMLGAALLSFDGKLKFDSEGGKLFAFILVFALICVCSAVTGLGNITDTNWVADFRNNFRLIISILYFFNFKSEIIIQNYIKYIDRIMYIVAAYQIVLLVLYFAFGIKVSSQGYAIRIIQPAQMVFVAFYALYRVYKDLWLDDKGHLSATTIAFITLVILDDYRTVWMSLIVGFLYLIIAYFIGGFTRKSLRLFIQLFLIFSVVAIMLLYSQSELVSTVVMTADTFNNLEDSSWATRTNLWQNLISTLSPLQWLLGQPFGTGYSAGIGWRTSPHSGWMEILMRTGLIGVSSLVLFFLSAWRRIRDVFCYQLVRAYILAQIVFFVGYAFTIDTGVCMGMIIVALSSDMYLIDFHPSSEIDNCY